MDYKPDESYLLFGADALLKRLQALSQEVEGVRRSEDIEYVHRMRVASRRLRAAFALFADALPAKRAAEWQKEIRRITRALGAARDTDVQIEFLERFEANLAEARNRPGIDRLLLRLRQQRAGAQTQVLRALERLESSRLIEEMGQALRQMLVEARFREVEPHSSCVYALAFLHISLRLEEMMGYSACVQHRDQVEELHAMRIAAKRLRYTMEIFGPLYPDELKKPLQAVRKIQEVLGDIHDCDVWVAFLPEFLEAESARMEEFLGNTRSMRRIARGLLHLQRERQETRERRFGEFVTLWDQVREEAVWKDLGRALRARPNEEGPAREARPREESAS